MRGRGNETQAAALVESANQVEKVKCLTPADGPEGVFACYVTVDQKRPVVFLKIETDGNGYVIDRCAVATNAFAHGSGPSPCREIE